MDPNLLGRGVVVGPGQRAPAPWSEARRVVVGAEQLAAPAEVVEELHGAWLNRTPVVVELAVDQGALAAAARQATEAPPHSLGPGFELPLERLHFLVWANTYDARSDELIWWHGQKALRTLAGSSPGQVADVRLAEGTEVLVDGGPIGPVTTSFPVLPRWNAEAGSARLLRPDFPGAALAPDQLAAVAHGAGPARVIAPAGSGKTRVLSERLRHLVLDRGVDPSVITVLAFNVRAADELKERCADFVTGGGPQIKTLNALGLAICTDAAGARVPVASEREVRDLLGRLFPMRTRTNSDPAAAYLEALSMVRLGLVSPARAQARLPEAAGLAEGFERYEAALAEQGVVDFDEQIYRAITILLADPAARARHQSRARILLVDEFQDLTPAHLLLIRLLAAPAFDVFGVGDDDQTIYDYSGADPRFLLDFDRFFPGATNYALEVNYRCAAPIVEAATKLLGHNLERLDKQIRPGRPECADGGGRAPEAAFAAAAVATDELGRQAAATVAAWHRAGVALEDIAVLARVNSVLLPALVGLLEAGIPAASALDSSLLGRTGVRSALAYLRLGLAPEHITRADLVEVVRRPARGIAPNVVEMLTKRPATSLAEIRSLARWLQGKDGPKVVGLAEDIAKVAAAARRSSAEALRTVRRDLKLGLAMDSLDAARSEADRSTHTDDLLALEAVAGLHPDAGSFEPWLRELLSRAAPEGPAVVLSSIHRVKGREWSYVMVFDASEGVLPHRLNRDVEAERRVMHVAITRAKDRVLVLANAEGPSRFLDEIAGRAPVAARSEGATAPPALGPEERRRSRRGRPRGPEEPASGPGSASQGVALEAGLRAWRTETARREQRPAYMVLTNEEVAGIAAAAPRTLAELAKCKGIGPVKLELWGSEILGVLSANSP